MIIAMDIKKPIFVIGSGRSGTTIFFRTLAQHKQVGYFTNFDSYFPRLFKSGIMPFLESNTLTKSVINRMKPIIPSKEIIGILTYCKIQEKGIPLSDEDVNLTESDCLTEMICKCLKYQKKGRFIAKNTINGMRIKYLDSIFPDSIFVHVMRDGRANVHSYLHIPFFKQIRFWWWGNKQLEDWITEGGSPLELAALHWKNNMLEIFRQSKDLPRERYFEIKYEDFTRDPLYFFKKTLDFCGLEWDKHFESIINNTTFKNTNYKWKTNLSPEQQEVIESILGDFLNKIGYA